MLDVAHKTNVAIPKISLFSLEEIDQELNENSMLTCPVNFPPAWKTIIVFLIVKQGNTEIKIEIDRNKNKLK